MTFFLNYFKKIGTNVWRATVIIRQAIKTSRITEATK